MSSSKINYLSGVVICHGKSEVNMVRYITTNLHLNIRQFSKHNGKNSIQITSLNSVLQSKPFDKKSSLIAEYPLEIKGRGAKATINNFKLFIIMDTDDCTAQQKEDFISKAMFKGHWLYDYIVPIYNITSLEDVLLDAGIMSKRIGDKEKGSYYDKIFPINKKPLSDDTVYEVNTLKAHLSSSNRTNMVVFIDYCLSLLNQ